MRYRDLIHKWGSEAGAARAIGLNRQTVNRWKRKIPLDQQIEIEKKFPELLADLPPHIRPSAQQPAA